MFSNITSFFHLFLQIVARIDIYSEFCFWNEKLETKCLPNRI